MNRRRRLALAAVGAAAIAAVLVADCSAGRPDAGSRLGGAVAAGVAQAALESRRLVAPRRCADLGLAARDLGGRLGPGRATLRGDVVEVPAGERAVIGFVADARGDGAATRSQLAAIARRFEAAGVDLIVALGGMGDGEEAIGAVLGVLAGGRAPVLALPGDREPIAAHRRAIARLRAAGRAVVDGSQVRFATAGRVTLATYPGAGAASGLLDAGGCLHRPEDAAALGRALAGRAGVRVIVSHAAPRGEDATASDLATGGIHVGEPPLTLAGAAADLVVHGLVDEAVLDDAEGAVRLGGGRPVALGVGPAEALPVGPLAGAMTVTGGALIVAIRGRQVRWERVVLRAGGERR